MQVANERGTLREGRTLDHLAAMHRLIDVVQELSHARDLETVTTIVRRAARELSGADGATFVLRDAGCCYYVDEDAIAPLWKGQRFPLEACVSGWAMLHKEPVVIEDIYADARVPKDAYRPTFVKSLCMVPIRTASPIGAIGNYWAEKTKPDPKVVSLLQALAGSTSIALENVQLYNDQERKIRERTAELEAANATLARKNSELSQVQALKDDLVSLIVHDVRNPLAGIGGCLGLIQPSDDAKDADDTRELVRIAREGVRKIEGLANDLLEVRKLESGGVVLEKEPVAAATLVRRAIATLGPMARLEGMKLEVAAESDPVIEADAHLLGWCIENLVSNAIKFSPSGEVVRVAVREAPDAVTIEVQDRGPGVPEEIRERLFSKFGSVEAKAGRRGFGLGLFFVRLVAGLHGGGVTAHPREGGGTVFSIRLPRTR